MYGDSLFAAIAESRRKALEISANRQQAIRYLERESWEFELERGEAVRILGATLWTDFKLFGPEDQSRATAAAAMQMNDYVYGKLRDPEYGEKRRLAPEDTARFHGMSVQFLHQELGKQFNGITIVMSHHAPSLRSIPKVDWADPLTPCYASSLDSMVEEYQPQLWVHGHIHIANDYRIGKTRVLSNPRGYTAGHANPNFDPALVIQI